MKKVLLTILVGLLVLLFIVVGAGVCKALLVAIGTPYWVAFLISLALSWLGGKYLLGPAIFMVIDSE